MLNEKFKCFIYTNGRSSTEMIWPHGSMRLSSHITFKCIRAWHFLDSVCDNDIFWLNKTLGSWPISQEMCNIHLFYPILFGIYTVKRSLENHLVWNGGLKNFLMKWTQQKKRRRNRVQKWKKWKTCLNQLKYFLRDFFSFFFGKRYCLHFFNIYCFRLECYPFFASFITQNHFIHPVLETCFTICIFIWWEREKKKAMTLIEILLRFFFDFFR